MHFLLIEGHIASAFLCQWKKELFINIHLCVSNIGYPIICMRRSFSTLRLELITGVFFSAQTLFYCAYGTILLTIDRFQYRNVSFKCITNCIFDQKRRRATNISEQRLILVFIILIVVIKN